MKHDNNLIKVDLYLEQIKYLQAENASIQEKFLYGSSIPLATLGLLVFYIENTETSYIDALYLFIPFLYFSIPYNLIKYTIRMLSINGYLKYLENKINSLLKDNVFIWNTKLINITSSRMDFVTLTSIPLIPMQLVIFLYLLYKFFVELSVDTYFVSMHWVLLLCLGIEFFGFALMLLEIFRIQRAVIQKAEEQTFYEEN